MRSGRDDGRAEVYAAELAAYDGTDLETVVPFDELVTLAARVTGEPWWPATRRVALRAARSDARSSTTRWRGGIVVRIAAPQATPATVVHELAHVLAGPSAGHGAAFRRAHVDLASAAFGAERASWLEAAYRASGLTLGARTWQRPPDEHRHAIAL
jgi:hypothetical protein